jgi:hypothetical protein
MNLFFNLVMFISFLSPCITLYRLVFYKKPLPPPPGAPIPTYWQSEQLVTQLIVDIGRLLEGVMYIEILHGFIKPFPVTGDYYCKVFRKIGIQ